MILTDIPFFMGRVFLNAAVTTSGENLGRYEFETITIGEMHLLLDLLSLIASTLAPRKSLTLSLRLLP